MAFGGANVHQTSPWTLGLKNPAVMVKMGTHNSEGIQILLSTLFL
jgi:hypothetical protein